LLEAIESTHEERRLAHLTGIEDVAKFSCLQGVVEFVIGFSFDITRGLAL
jgi:hypothetical protein